MDKQELKQKLEGLGRGAQAALAAHLGYSASVTNKLINTPRKITADEATKIQDFLETYGQESEGIPSPNGTPAPAAPRPPIRQEMAKDVPVYGTIVGGSHTAMADFEMNGQIVDYVRRPPRLAGRKDVFAAFCQGESMLYWREPGQLVYFERAKPPKNNDYVLVELKPPPHDHDGVRPALIKRLIGVTPTKLKLRQYNPQKDFEIDRDKVLQVVRALDWDELMGV